MSDLPFERTFRRWCEREGVEWCTLRYDRPGAGGSTEAHHFRPEKRAHGGVMFVHGAGNDALFSFTGLFSRLLGKGYEIFSFDLDGHGRSNRTLLTKQAAADAVPAALEAWERRGMPAVVRAVGISLGGSLLLRALGGRDTPFVSAVLVSAPLRVELSWKAIGRELGPPMMRTLWRGRRHFGWTGLIPSFGPFKRETYPLRLGEAPGAGPFGYVEPINELLDSWRLEDAARATAIPVLLVYGALDRLVPAAQGRRLSELMPRSELLLLPADTHLSAPLSSVTETRLMTWLERHDAASGSVA